MKKLLNILALSLLALLGMIIVVEVSQAKEQLNQARQNRIDACLQAYEDVKPTTYHHDQNLIARCATYATLV